MTNRKLVIQIPCMNETDNLHDVISGLPTSIPGIDKIETLVVDDGSTDGTTQRAIELGVTHVLRFAVNRGLARTFETGLYFATFSIGADIIVNTDGDNQYKGEFIPALIEPIMDGRADMVVGRRDYEDVEHFSALKKQIIWFGSKVMSALAKTPCSDAPSGFRAFSKRAASRITILSRYTYTMETIVQANSKNITIDWVPVKTNAKTRQSRLMKSMLDYIFRTGVSLVAIILLYAPTWVLIFGVGFAAAAALLVGILCGAENGLILGGLIFGMSTMTALMCKVANTHRIRQEEMITWLIHDVNRSDWASRLGATEYYHQGELKYPSQ